MSESKPNRLTIAAAFFQVRTLTIIYGALGKVNGTAKLIASEAVGII